MTPEKILELMAQKEREIVRFESELEKVKEEKRQVESAWRDMCVLLGERLLVSEEIGGAVTPIGRRIIVELVIPDAFWMQGELKRTQIAEWAGQKLGQAIAVKLAADPDQARQILRELPVPVMQKPTPDRFRA